MFANPRILVCSDFSRSSDIALKRAGELAEKTSGTIDLLHVAELAYYMNINGNAPEFSSVDQNVWEEITGSMVKSLYKQLERCGVSAKTHVRIETSVITGILKESEEFKADIIFVGHTGASGIDKFLFGNVAKKVCSASTIPVFVIKNENTIDRFAALVDPESVLTETIKPAEELSSLYSGKYSVVSLLQQFPGLYSENVMEYSSVVGNALRNQTELETEKLKDKIAHQLVGKEVSVIVKPSYEKDLSLHLSEILLDEGVNLAIMKKHHKSALERYFLGSVSSRVLELFPGNMLIL